MDPSSSERHAAFPTETTPQGGGGEEQGGFPLMKKLTESFRNFWIWLGWLSTNAPSADDRASGDEANHAVLLGYTPMVMIAVMVLLGILLGLFCWLHLIE